MQTIFVAAKSNTTASSYQPIDRHQQCVETSWRPRRPLKQSVCAAAAKWKALETALMLVAVAIAGPVSRNTWLKLHMHAAALIGTRWTIKLSVSTTTIEGETDMYELERHWGMACRSSVVVLSIYVELFECRLFGNFACFMFSAFTAWVNVQYILSY